MKLLDDIKMAAGIFKEILGARKTGAEIELKHTAELPVLGTAPSFFCTVEGCALAAFDFEIAEKIQTVFKEFDYDTKRWFVFAPKDGEFWERAKFWKNVIHEAFPEGGHRHRAMKAILETYIRIKGYGEMPIPIP